MVDRVPHIIDYKRNNKLNIGHNFTETFDFHDVVRLLLMKQLRRKYNSKNPIYTEHDPNKPNGDYPDIWMRIGKDVYVWELQRTISKKWEKQIMEKYAEVNLIIVPLEKIYDKWYSWTDNACKEEPIKKLNKLLEPYVL